LDFSAETTSMYHRLMVPLDGTVDCQHAIPVALSIAAREEAVVELVHIAMPPSMVTQVNAGGLEMYAPPNIDVESAESIHAIAAQRLATITEEVVQAGQVRVESTVLDRSDVARAIAEHAEETKPDLLVMTTHDHSRLERLILGSVSESVVRRVNAPVLLVPASPEQPLLSRRVSITHVLVPLDGSDLAASIIPHARDIARAMNSRVSLFMVSEETVLPPPPGLAAFETVEPSASDATKFLEGAAKEFRDGGIDAQVHVTIGRDRARAILDFAEANRVDLIAMSTHGRRGIGRLVAGSVASSVLHNAKTPVMMYKPEQQG
jgi:nucleotide-binding universal stress UspA family protein